MRKTVRSAFLLLIFWVCTLPEVFGQKEFTGPDNGFWSVSSNWSPAGVPGANDDVIIPGGKNVLLDIANALCRDLQLGKGAGAATLTFQNATAKLTTGGVVTLGVSGDASRTGSIDMSGGGTLISQGLRVLQQGSTFIPGSGTVEFTGTNTIPGVVEGTSTSITTFSQFHNLTINGGTTSLGVNLLVSGDILVSSGELDLVDFTVSRPAAGGSLTIADGGTLRINANNFPEAFATIELQPLSTVIYDGANQRVAPVTYGNLTLEGSGTKNITGVQTINGDLMLSGTASATLTDALTLGGSIQITDAAVFIPGVHTVTLTGILEEIASPAALEFETLVINGSYTNNIVNGGLIINGGLQGSGSLAQRFGGSRLELRGQCTIGALTANVPGSTVVYAQNTPGQVVRPVGYRNLELRGGASKIMTAVGNIAGSFTIDGAGTSATLPPSTTTVGSISIGAGASLTINHALNLSGNWVNNGTFNGTGSTITFNSGNQQAISGNSVSTFENISLLKSGVPLSLQADMVINGQLTFSNGIISPDPAITPLRRVIFNPGSTVLNARNPTPSDNSVAFIAGPVEKVGNSAFVFPIGSNGKYVPLSISAPANVTDAFMARYVPSNARNLGAVTAPGLERVSACEYWTLDRTSGNSNVHVTIGWTDFNACPNTGYVTDPASVVVASLNSSVSPSVWDDYGPGNGNSGTQGSGTSTTGQVTWSNVSRFGTFTLGTTSLANTLPVKFASIKAVRKTNSIEVSFSNLSEEHVAAYHVERSADGSAFVTIGTVPPKGNGNVRADYTFLDRTPMNGNNFYRIRAVETTGKVVYSAVVRMDMDGQAPLVLVFPNPAPPRAAVSLQMNNLPAGKYLLRVYNQVGQMLYTRQLEHTGGAVSQALPAENWASGRYIVELRGAVQFSRTLLIR